MNHFHFCPECRKGVEMTITSHGQTFKAYMCAVCHGLDTDPVMLAKHEEMHGVIVARAKSVWAKTLNPRPKGIIYHKSEKPRKKRGAIHA